MGIGQCIFRLFLELKTDCKNGVWEKHKSANWYVMFMNSIFDCDRHFIGWNINNDAILMIIIQFFIRR